jgi:hypothetical protein
MKKKENSIEKKLKKGYKYYTLAILVGLVTIGGATNVLAADDPISVVNNLSNFIFSLTRALGLIITGYAVVQIGLSFTSHDPSQRANGFMFVAGGLIITFAKEILDLISK